MPGIQPLSIENIKHDALAAVKASDLFHEASFVGGQWLDAEDAARQPVRDPADGTVLGSVPLLAEPAGEAAAAAAAAALPGWRGRLASERGALLRRWMELILAERETLARIMVLEQGKPYAEALGEIDYGASFVGWFAAEGERLNGEIPPSHISGRRLLVWREPIGVVLAVTPWNFPSAMIARKAAAALAAGCPVIVKPALETPFSALALARLAERAGFPPGVFNVVTGPAEELVKTILAHDGVRALSFTGSTTIGRHLIRQSADRVLRVSLELGGHAPVIVLADAPLKRAIEQALDAKYATGGQDCLAANRILVERPLYERFAAAFAEGSAALTLGHGLQPGVAVGPLIGPTAIARCEAQVADALGKGARLLTGGRGLGGNFMAPTVLAEVTPDMRIFREETFGPVAALMPFDAREEAIRLANDSLYGLAAYVLCGRLENGLSLAGRLDYGMVAVNGVKMTGPPVPFGGMKQSGLGREGSRLGIEEFTEVKYVCLPADVT